MSSPRPVRRVVILGADARDFHNFNVVYRDDPAFDVVAFTAAQIPDITGRRYPPALAEAVRGKRVLVVEDGPSTTHGGMAYGAGYVAAIKAGAATIVHPQPFAAPEIAALYAEYPHLGPVLPAMGYSPAQLAALARSIDAAPADVVVSGTPIDLAALVRLTKPVVRARYEMAEVEAPGLGGEIDGFLARAGLAR